MVAIWERWPIGLRVGLPLLLPTAAVGISFGLLAGPQLGALPAVLMSALVWSGTAQFASLSVLGGGPVLAAATGLLANTRFVPMSFAVAPSVTGGPLRRIVLGGMLADASFVIGRREHGRFDPAAIAWSWPPQYVGWVGGTVAGVLGADALGDPAVFGLDAFFPIFYLSLLLPELTRGSAAGRRRLPLVVAALAAAVTLALTPVAPPGIPVLAAASVALVGLRKPR